MVAVDGNGKSVGRDCMLTDLVPYGRGREAHVASVSEPGVPRPCWQSSHGFCFGLVMHSQAVTHLDRIVFADFPFLTCSH